MIGDAKRAEKKQRRIEREARDRMYRARREPCARCGYTRGNVIHETDRENAPEGLAYYENVPFCEFQSA